MPNIRLDKYLSNAGVGTRSEIKSYIRKGLVSVNGVVAVRPETKVNVEHDIIKYIDEVISLSEFEYYLLYKPAGYVSATKDDLHPTVLSLIDSNRRDLFPAGRLDKDTEGLLLITNDGELSHRLLSPRHHVEKTYYAILDGPVTEKHIQLFAEGLEIGDEDFFKALPAKLEVLPDPLNYVSSYYREILESCSSVNTHKSPATCFVLVTIKEGKYHQVKRMFQKVGRKVLYLKRISMGKLTLPENLNPGDYITLDKKMVDLYFNDLKC